MNPTIETILSRTSDRQFETGHVIKDSDIELLLRAAMAAPTAVNRQPWYFVVVTDRRLLDALADTLPYCHMARQAPLAVVVCGDSRRFLDGDDSSLWVQDVSAASENLLLAAHSMGLGAVWTCLYPHADRMEPVSCLLDLPEFAVPFNVIPVGYVSKAHKPLDKWRDDAVAYRR